MVLLLQGISENQFVQQIFLSTFYVASTVLDSGNIDIKKGQIGEDE